MSSNSIKAGFRCAILNCDNYSINDTFPYRVYHRFPLDDEQYVNKYEQIQKLLFGIFFIINLLLMYYRDYFIIVILCGMLCKYFIIYYILLFRKFKVLIIINNYKIVIKSLYIIFNILYENTVETGALYLMSSARIHRVSKYAHFKNDFIK